jgi:hypothetical protein
LLRGSPQGDRHPLELELVGELRELVYIQVFDASSTSNIGNFGRDMLSRTPLSSQVKHYNGKCWKQWKLGNKQNHRILSLKVEEENVDGK